jgi:predicted amidohydrolase YtcJ
MARVQSLGPDLVFVNARGLITMEGAPTLDRMLTAIAVREGRIVALGPDSSIAQMAGDAPVIDLEGTVVMPGLIDCHNHFLRTTLGWDRVQIAEAASIEELVDTIALGCRDTPPGEWVLCSSRWHETNLAERRMPTAEELDRAAPDNPVYLPRGGHVVVTNSLGLELAGIHRSSQDPPGGAFVRDSSGNLTGMLVERPAFDLLTRLLPQPGEQDRRLAIRAGIDVYNRAGITTVRDPGLGAAEVRSYQAVVPEEQSLRLSLMWRVDLASSPEEQRAWIDGLAPVSGFGDQWISIWGLKLYTDGGVEGGYFRDAYANDSTFRGFPLMSQENLQAILEQSHDLGWRVGVHVVGDAAMDMALDSFEKVDARSPISSRGHTLEHGFSPVPGAIERARDAGIGVTLQHSLVYSLAGNMLKYWGKERAEACTPSRAWLDSGTLVGAGTDSPVVSHDPWLNIYGFATRDTQTAGILGPEHRISVAEALQCYTAGSAAILGQGHFLGALAPGKAADFICLDRDPLSSSPEEVRNMIVKKTVVGGRQVYSG